VTVVYGVPPVMLRLICCGDDAVQAGNLVTGLGADEVVGWPPLARAADMDGLEVVINLPHIPVDSELASHPGRLWNVRMNQTDTYS
jgi:hypothetical protein